MRTEFRSGFCIKKFKQNSRTITAVEYTAARNVDLAPLGNAANQQAITAFIAWTIVAGVNVNSEKKFTRWSMNIWTILVINLAVTDRLINIFCQMDAASAFFSGEEKLLDIKSPTQTSVPFQQFLWRDVLLVNFHNNPRIDTHNITPRVVPR